MTPFKTILSLGFLAFATLAVRGCWPGNNSYMASLGLTVPNSAVLSQQHYSGLTSDEDLLLIQLTPNQIASLSSHFKKNPDYSPGPLDARPPTMAPTKQFFASVPRGAFCGTFRVDHTDTSSSWPTMCTFAVDKSTGKLWFYGIGIYN